MYGIRLVRAPRSAPRGPPGPLGPRGAVRWFAQPRPNEKYLSQRGEQPTPLSAEDLRAQEVREIELPQATTEEKIQIKAVMKKRSLRMTFVQLFLITLLSSSTLNVMRQKNELEEVEDVFGRELAWLKRAVAEVERGEAVWEDVEPQLQAWNARFESLGLPIMGVKGVKGVDRVALGGREAQGAQGAPGAAAPNTGPTALDRFL